MKSWWWAHELCQESNFYTARNFNAVQKAAYFDIMNSRLRKFHWNTVIPQQFLLLLNGHQYPFPGQMLQ